MLIHSTDLDIVLHLGLKHELSFTIPATHGTKQGLYN